MLKKDDREYSKCSYNLAVHGIPGHIWRTLKKTCGWILKSPHRPSSLVSTSFNDEKDLTLLLA